jgi:flagellar biosynthesis component FlhA
MTKKQAVKTYLETHKKGLTDELAKEKLDVARLSTVIRALEKEGVKIKAEVKKPRGKEPYVIYTLA